MSSVTFFTSDMDKVREEVRALQEHRARVLMEQITEMQKERDVANARIRTLERTVLGESHCMCMYIYQSEARTYEGYNPPNGLILKINSD